MTIHWWTLAIGFVLGSALGAVAWWQIGPRLLKRTELRELTRDYAGLAGRYAQFRIRINGADAGTLEPTGRTIEIVWHPADGLLEASAFQANGNPEWHSYIKMSREYAGTGIGHYNNVNSIHGGIQQIIYSRRIRSFSVRGIDHTRKEFVHCWKPADQPDSAQITPGSAPARAQDGPTFNPDPA